MEQAEYRIKQTEVIRKAEEDLNTRYLKEFSFRGAPWKGTIGIRNHELRQILERMELFLDSGTASHRGVSRGLGINNLLFMATELLLLGALDEPYLPLVLIEEPEAHLHPQLQQLLVEYLEARAKKSPTAPHAEVQIILTSHSPNLASKVAIQSLVLMQSGKVFRMSPEHTQLNASDYTFLRRFLDVTKANLFFARGLIIVEGDAEHLLLPAIADRICQGGLVKCGVSIVNVGHVGLFRYARIFQRKCGPEMEVRVACIADRDIPPAEAEPYLNIAKGEDAPRTEGAYTPDELEDREARLKRNDGGPVKTFVSPAWTLEYDLAVHGLAAEMHAAIRLAKIAARESRLDHPLTDEECRQELQRAREECGRWLGEGMTPRAIAAEVYRPLYRKQASKAETAQFLARLIELEQPTNLRDRLPPYLVEAIDYASGASKSAPDLPLAPSPAGA